MRNFIAIKPEIINNSLCYIATSTERSFLSCEFTSKKVIDFLFSLHALGRRKELKAPVFIWYDTQIIVEQILKDLPSKAKDIFFPSPETERKRKEIRERIRELDGIKKRGKIIKARAKELRARLHALEYVYWSGYRLRVRAGKSLTICKYEDLGDKDDICWLDKSKHSTKNLICKRGLTIYDIYGFFKQPFWEVCFKYLGDRYTINRDIDLLSFPKTLETGAYINYLSTLCEQKAAFLRLLALKLNDYLQTAGLKLTRWYGASSVVNTLLRQWNVKREFKRLTPRNTPHMLLNAINCAFYGGRIETTKLGMIRNVYVYDLNSAFAYATTLLPKLNHGWQYTREYDESVPFALWHVEYELPSGAYIGLLPHRKGNGTICYRRAGRGWYYAPEIREVVRRYKDGVNIRIKEGYIVDYSPVSFADKINEIYNHRLALIAREGKGKGEKLFKSMLQVFYGKFSQSVGDAPYYCLPWAGWITSYVRAQMLQVIRGQEQDIIYFHTDAVHSVKPLVQPQAGINMGEWTVNYYPIGFYMASGVHCFFDTAANVIKSATRGFEFIDFDEAIRELNEPESFGKVTLKREFFAGHQYATAFPTDGNYLQTVKQMQKFDPREVTPRRWSRESFDWSNTYLDSRIIDYDDGRASSPRSDEDLKRRISLALDVR